MNLHASIGGLIVLASISSSTYYAWAARTAPTCTTQPAAIPVVVHVEGGLIEVSVVQTVETLERTSGETILGIQVGKTVARIRVPAVYRYHVELGPNWTVLLREKSFIVISPPVRPSIPVAIDTEKLEAESSGRWALLTGRPRIDELQRLITKSLASKAESAAYVQLQREVARQTLKEFVAKWLVTQEQWKGASAYPIRVYFADEPIQSLNAMPQPFAGQL